MKHLHVIRGRVRAAINVLENVTKCYLYSADMCVWGGHRQPLGTAKKKDFSLKWVKQVFFPVPVCPRAGVVAFIQRVCPQLAIPPCLSSSFLEIGRSDQGGRSSLVLGMEDSQILSVP